MKKKDFLTEYILYLIVKSEVFLLCFLPLRFSLWLGRRFADVLYVLIGGRRPAAYANLQAAFRGRYSPCELARIIKRVYYSLAQSYVELLKFPLLGEAYVKKYIKIEGEDKVRKALEEKGKGAILLTAHFGNWELASLIGSARGFKMNVLARWQKFERLNGYLNKIRGSRGANIIFKDDAIEEITRALNNNEVVGILSDQDGGVRGEFVDFFGRPASMPRGAAHFSLKTGAPVFPVFIIREGNSPYHRVVVEDDISIPKSGNIKNGARDILQRFANVLQSRVESNPGQWLWLHKRWKSTPVKYLLALSDGKAGHLKQSEAIADMIKELRSEKGRKDVDTIVGSLEIKFRNSFMRTIFEAGSFLGVSLPCLSFCFPADVYDKIKSSYADFIISCGSSLAGLNLSLKRLLGAKSVVIMRPNIYRIRDFDLVVIPAHDRIKSSRNVVVTAAAVTGLSERLFFDASEVLRARAGISKGRFIGALVGGDSKAYVLEPDLISRVLDEVLSAAEELDAQIVITTSRRTSPVVEDAIKAKLKGSEMVKLVVIANENNFNGAIEGILGLSDILLVSGESIAMVSEAVGSGKKVLVFMPRKKRAFFRTKQEITMRNFRSRGLIALAEVQKLKAEIAILMRQAPSKPVIGDREAIKSALRKIM
ncbi:MAG: ELM1/GtrOC1 family putative glycosyltransferase [Candidatus Omnitrophota bacterium]